MTECWPLTSMCLGNANSDGITWQWFSMSLRRFALMFRVIFLSVKTLSPWGSCLILSDLFFHPKKKITSNWSIFLIREHKGIVHMTPSLCRDTRGLYSHEPLRKINRSESVEEKHLVLRLYILTPQNSGEGGTEGGRYPTSWLPLGAAENWTSCKTMSAYLLSSSTLQDHSKMQSKAQKVGSTQIFCSNAYSWP